MWLDWFVALNIFSFFSLGDLQNYEFIDDKPIWGREPVVYENPPRQDSARRPQESIRKPIPLLNQNNPQPVQTTTKSPPKNTILRRQVGLKSQEMCRKYCKKSILSLSVNLASLSDPSKLEPLIIDGRESKEKEFPHMTAIGSGAKEDISWICGGTLISEYYVLTAAHCTKSKGRIADWALLGSTKLLRNGEDANENQQLIKIQDHINHPDYLGTPYNDIALLRLTFSAIFNDFVRPACLPALPSGKVADFAVASGWGRTSPNNVNDPGSNTLLEVTLNILDPLHCKIFGTASGKLPRGIDDKLQICAGVLGERKNTCTGDSGGPLQVPEGYCGITVLGITSFGTQFSNSNNVGLYTRVKSYIQWIEDQVWVPTASESFILERP